MKTVILAGGLGTRLAEETDVKPKPMVQIGGVPILWHVMKIYAAAGFREFVIALGYRGDVVKSYFLNYHYFRNNLTISGDGGVEVHRGVRDDWLVDLVDTGLETQTGGRIRRLADQLRDNTFMLTYGDGLADIDCRELVKFHRSHGKLATVTAVRPPARFGGIVFEGKLVTEFIEKPQIGDGWINGGYFVLEPGVLDYIDGDETIWERDPLERLVADGQLAAYQHDGFWQPMDTLRDVLMLRELCESGEPPWKVWP
jgi:glucose-1-phosphate cytidylyltransferase